MIKIPRKQERIYKNPKYTADSSGYAIYLRRKHPMAAFFSDIKRYWNMHRYYRRVKKVDKLQKKVK